MAKSRWLKIAVVALIVIVIAGIWVYKKQNPTTGGHSIDDGHGHSLGELGLLDGLVVTSLELQELKDKGLPIMIAFGGEDCSPCKAMRPDLEEMYVQFHEKVTIVYGDVWADSTLADGFPVEVVPTQFFFDKDGNPYIPSDPEGMDMLLYQQKSDGVHMLTAHQGKMSKDQMITVFKELGVDTDTSEGDK